MEAKLKAFLGDCRVSKGEPFTHTTKSTGSLPGGWSSGSYYIEDSYIKDFWTHYCNAVRDATRSTRKSSPKVLTVTERPGAYGPLRVDFDFKSNLDKGLKRKYTVEILKKVVTFFQDEIRNIIDPQYYEDKMLWCIVLEKAAPRNEDGRAKDGFHFHFPHFVCDAWTQDIYLRDKVSKRMVEEGIWKQRDFVTPVEEFIDKNIARKPWMMYGSMNYKTKKSSPYLYNRWNNIPPNKRYGHAYDDSLKELHLGEVFEDEMVGRKKSVRYYLPRFMSIRGFTQTTPLIQEIETVKTKATTRNKRRKRKVQRTRTDEDIMEDIKLIKDGEIMDMISDDRADNYHEWMDVGWTLFNIGQGCQEALDMWIDFSRRSSKFVEGECEDLWYRMELRDKTIASLLSMARSDSPDEYKEWKDTNIESVLYESLVEVKPVEYDIAKVVVKMFGDEFICADAKKDVWYHYYCHRWRLMDDAIALRLKFVKEVLLKYCELRKKMAEKVANIDYIKDGYSDFEDMKRDIGMKVEKNSEMEKLVADRNRYQMLAKKCSAVIVKLKEGSFHRKLIDMCKLDMHNKDFMKKRDENRKLFGCENGVLDLNTMHFRDGRPDDYITFSCGQYYREFNNDDEEVHDLDMYLLKVYPNKNRREYFLDFSASCLEGGNVNKRFMIATGPSDGAKSMTFSLLELVFGTGEEGYFGKFSRELITQPTGRSSSSGPRPELNRVRGKRVMGCQEITKQEKVNGGFIKEATGNDSFYTRGMYEKGTEIFPQFTLMMQCNEPPEIPGHDEATWSRVRVLDHESKFVAPHRIHEFPVPKTFKEQLKMKRFHADPNFKEELPDLAPVLLWKLFQRYKTYKKKGLHEPKEVLISTDIYKTNNDVYLQFIDERLEKVGKKIAPKTYVKLAEVFDEFKEWYRDNFPSFSKEKIGKNTMKIELNKRIGMARDSEKELYGFGKMNRWWGYRFKQEEDVEDEFHRRLKPEDE